MVVICLPYDSENTKVCAFWRFFAEKTKLVGWIVPQMESAVDKFIFKDTNATLYVNDL